MDGSLQLEINKPPAAGLLYEGEVSGNLIDWNKVERMILRNDEQIFRIRDQLGLETSQSRFMRMMVHPQK